jgi:hypothetical protein
MASHDPNALLMQRMEDSSLRQLWRLTNVLIKIRNGALIQKDVKNAGRSGYVLENKGEREMEKDRSGYVDERKQVAR